MNVCIGVQIGHRQTPASALVVVSCTSPFVKGCKMPAPSGRPVSLHANSTGRRLTSLKGGNRGRQPRGYGSQSCYGDLSCDFLVPVSKVPGHHDVHMSCRFGCHPLAPVSLFMSRVKARISMPSVIRCRDRLWPIRARQVAGEREPHDAVIRLGGARGSCPRSKVSMMIMAAPQSGQT